MPKKTIKLEELASLLGGELLGDGNVSVSGIRDIEEAGAGDLAFIMRRKKSPFLLGTKASCVVVPQEIKESPVPIIKCKSPNLAFKKAVELLMPDYLPHPAGVNKHACVSSAARIGKNVSIGANTIIEDGAFVGDNTIIYGNCYIGNESSVGESCVIYPTVTVREKITIGKRVIIHSGSVIGSDGFGYEQTPAGHAKIPQIGDVIIGDDVEIGASVTVDRGKFSHTRIGRGTKIDNLVQIAHNVTIGSNCIIVAQCGISGSVKVGNNVMMGGQVGIADHMEIGDNVLLAAQAAVMKSVPPNTIMWGKPARPLKKAKAIYAIIDKLPEIYAKLKFFEKKFGLPRSIPNTPGFETKDKGNGRN
ncbi:MAG: UDP-3-O-(3-hydroxymyristoyl)glucosamine N-acyltransferase [Candidatus Omnitrophica bacterium]|nr:UDP-3-O-(3-hydroxymyristoyl)glucosamine N-acyltransferase [Candidatus Omnitrophota bacterium]